MSWGNFMKKIIIAASLLALGLGSSCKPTSADTPSPGSMEPEIESASRPNRRARRIDAKARKAPVIKHVGPMTLIVDGSKDCVRLEIDGPCYYTLENLQTGAPDLLQGTGRDASALALAVDMIGSNSNDLLVKDSSEAESWWQKWFEPNNALEQEHFGVESDLSAPDFEEIKEPALENDVLVYFTVRSLGVDRGAEAYRNEVDFKAKAWKRIKTPLKKAPRARQSANVIELFGGAIQSFARAKSNDASLFLAVRPTGGAAPFVWHPKVGDSERFMTWEALFAKHPEAASKALASSLARVILGHQRFRTNFDHGRELTTQFPVITDTTAYKAEYKSKNKSVLKLRYQVDQVKVTNFAVTNWAAIVDPQIVDGELIAFFEDNDGQPHRLSYRLSEFSADVPAHIEPFFTSEEASGLAVPSTP